MKRRSLILLSPVALAGCALPAALGPAAGGAGLGGALGVALSYNQDAKDALTILRAPLLLAYGDLAYDPTNSAPWRAFWATMAAQYPSDPVTIPVQLADAMIAYKKASTG